MDKIFLCIGDSLTTGFGVSPKDSWFSICKNELTEYKWVNKGINGDTISSMLCRLHNDLITSNANHVFIMGGSNDFLMNKEVDYVYESFLLCIEDIRSFNATPIVGIPPKCYGPSAKIYWDPYVDYSKFNTKIEMYRQSLKSFCENNSISYIDLCEFISNDETSYIDGLHPSKEMHKLVSDKFLNKIKESN